MKLILLAGFLLFSGLAFSQKDKYREGILYTSKGDTIRGKAAWKKDCSPDDLFYFKQTGSDQEQTISWSEILEFRNREGSVLLKVASIRRNLEYIDGTDFNIRLKDSTTTGSFPLVPVYIGRKLSLYTLYDKSTFFFLDDGRQIKQLVQKYRYLTTTERMFDFERGRRYHMTDEFKGVLAAYYDFSEDPKMRYILANTLFEELSFKYLISKMDNKMR